MTTVLFERRPHVYLPEIAAYLSYLEAHYPHVRAYDSQNLGSAAPDKFDVVWRFMGTDVKGEGDFIVHEYNSLSAGFAPKLKNTIKKMVNRKPNRRVFLSQKVCDDFGFKDEVPFGLRDMGVADAFFDRSPEPPQYDFVYAGSVDRGAEVINVLQYFASAGHDMTVLIVGSVSSNIRQRFAPYSNIVFAGRVPYEGVPQYMAQGKMGLNLLPDRYPFNIQTATKVLEYCALGLPIVSMRYPWIEQFMEERGGKAFYLEPDYSNLTLQNVKDFNFKTPNVIDLRWNNIIKQSGIFSFLDS